MKVTDRLLADAAEIWEKYHAHPFVTGIGDGSLPQEKFRYYMIQDYLYLYEYAKVFAIGVSKARDERTMALFAGYVDRILHGEMEIHRGYMKRLGIDLSEAEAACARLANLSYTSYMLKTAYEEGPAEIAASILSCAVSYEVIARKLAERFPGCAKHPFYGEWIRGYADEGYHEANVELAELVERLAAGYAEKQVRHLSEIFRVCSLYELCFWDMAWENDHAAF